MSEENGRKFWECPRCDSSNTIFKKTTLTMWCRRCGAEWKVPEQEKTRRDIEKGKRRQF